jgi:carboxymethylenebutenolidase
MTGYPEMTNPHSLTKFILAPSCRAILRGLEQFSRGCIGGLETYGRFLSRKTALRRIFRFTITGELLYTPPMRRPVLHLIALLLLLPLAVAPLQAQDWAKARLDASPRHHEYINLKHGDRTVQAFVVYPEVKTKASVIVLIHEIFGLSDWAKEMADELAAQGFIVVAPDLLTGFGPNNGASDSFPSMDATTKAVSGLDPVVVNADLDAAADYAKKIPAANGKIAVVGFCWGGGKSFAFAAHRKDLSAAFVFYGPGPADVTTITAPVYGFYAGNDARIGATIPATTEAMKAAGKKYEPVTYDGAGHGFMRAGEDPTQPTGNTTAEMAAANKKARDQGFTRLVTLIKEMKTAPMASNATHNKTVATKKPSTPDAQCHDSSMQKAGSM